MCARESFIGQQYFIIHSSFELSSLTYRHCFAVNDNSSLRDSSINTQLDDMCCLEIHDVQIKHMYSDNAEIRYLSILFINAKCL